MQELSFDPGHPILGYDGWRLSLEIITFENLYGVAGFDVTEDAGVVTARASALTWAGGQERAEGTATIELRSTDDGFEAVVSAQMPQRIRCTKLIVSGLPRGAELIGHRWRSEPVRRSGTTVRYPSTTHTPLIFLELPDGAHLYFSSLDDRVREKRFTVVQRHQGATVELIHEDAGHEMTSETRTPPWRIGRTRDPADIAREHEGAVAQRFGLRPWEERTDVPAWMRDVSLLISLHGMHWSGYVFDTYDDMRAAIEFVCERIDGRRVLAFLPGWEGRYYWQYGAYRPEPRLGGEAGFARLAARARELGAHVMPMFGANCVNRALPSFETWGATAEMRSAGGLAFQGNRPDWDTSRAHDPGWQVWLNPGVAAWRERLVEQVSQLVAAHEIPAVFFDTDQAWINDAQAGVFEGLVALRDELRARFPDLLIAGEGWYDALGAVTPLSHTPAHLPERWPEMFARYNRCFLHLAAGDPSRGSTGVHEAGVSEFELAPDEPHFIPTLTLVDGTIERGQEGVERVIAQAREYARRYL